MVTRVSHWAHVEDVEQEIRHIGHNKPREDHEMDVDRFHHGHGQGDLHVQHVAVVEDENGVVEFPVLWQVCIGVFCGRRPPAGHSIAVLEAGTPQAFWLVEDLHVDLKDRQSESEWGGIVRLSPQVVLDAIGQRKCYCQYYVGFLLRKSVAV